MARVHAQQLSPWLGMLNKLNMHKRLPLKTRTIKNRYGNVDFLESIVWCCSNTGQFSKKKFAIDTWRFACGVYCSWLLLKCSPIHHDTMYCQISSIRCTKLQDLNVSRLVLQLSLPNPLEPGVKSRMKMYLEQRRQSICSNYMSNQQFYGLLRCDSY